MPYILNARRLVIDNYLASIDRPSMTALLAGDSTPQDCGELNYAFTMTCLRYTDLKYRDLDARLARIASDYVKAKPLRYQRINDLCGAFACAALEMRDRCPDKVAFRATLESAMQRCYHLVAVPYEKTKIAENGDIAEYGSPR